MLIPTRRWLGGAALLALTVLAAYRWPPALDVLLLLDVLWVALLLWDGRRAGQAALEVERDAPPAFSLGRTLPVWYRWTSRGASPQRAVVRELMPAPLGGADQPDRALRLIPGVTRERLDLEPAKRGVGSGGTLSMRRQGPWGLAWRQERKELPWTATVFPSLTGVITRGLPAQAVRRREAGLRSVRRPGEGRLFEGLREWVPGDDTRLIDWKATARRRKPIARVYEDERRQRVLILLDAGRLLTAESDGVPRLERAIQAALRLAYAAVDHDDDVGLLAFADTIQAYVAPARGRRALRAILDALASVEGRLVESNYPLAFRYLATRNRKRALTVFFTDVIDRTASAALVAQSSTLRPRHLPVAVTLKDPALERLASARPQSDAEAYERAAAEELLLAREQALDTMRKQGVLVLDVPPESAGEAVVQRYHVLKRRGVL
jgi:uncharacterized protein (DUF58 family)